MRAVEVAHLAVQVAGENGNRRALVAFAVFAAPQVVLEGVIAGAEQAQLPRRALAAEVRFTMGSRLCLKGCGPSTCAQGRLFSRIVG
jgi:hypothetical protein